MEDEHIYLRLDLYRAGWLATQMELLMREYTDRGIEQEKHYSDKAEAFRVASAAGEVLALLNDAMAKHQEMEVE